MTQLIVVAKEPVPGRVKTRLCPPCTPPEAAGIAAAALADTLDVLSTVAAARRTLLIDGDYPVPPGWVGVAQRGSGLAERLANGFADTALPGVPSLLVGMDTPQLTGASMTAAVAALTGADVVLGPADDGGWWALGLRHPADAAVLREVPMSTPDTASRTVAAFAGRRVVLLPRMRDVDTFADAHEVAALCPAGSRFAAAVTASGRPRRPGGTADVSALNPVAVPR